MAGIEAMMDLVRRALDSDIFYSFRRSPVVVVAAIVTVAFFAGAVFAPLIAPQNPFDLRQLNLMDASLPPMWLPDGMPEYPLGTDTQGGRISERKSIPRSRKVAGLPHVV